MKSSFSLSLFFFIVGFSNFGELSAQHNLLGKSQDFIEGLYKYDPEFFVEKDTLNEDKILITCKSSETYPYHTYEIDLTRDRCVSYGYVSKNPDILKTYLEVLGYLGKVVQTDNNFSNFVYEVCLDDRTVYYSIRRPYSDSSVITRRNIFYILITENVPVKTISSPN